MDVKLIAARTTMWRKAGDAFTKPHTIAKAMVALRLARYADEPPIAEIVKKKRGRPKKDPNAPKRTYKRRDMTAE
jgi:hypothetical protein